MPIRTASDSELELVYRMGFDVWGEGLGLDDYLAGCRASPKYAAGVWRVLAGDDGCGFSRDGFRDVGAE